MKVTLINEYKDRFKAYLNDSDVLDNAFYFEVIKNWKENWNGEGRNLSEIYDASLQSKTSARLWGGNVDSPKSMMIRLIVSQEEFVRDTFRDLFNETLDLGLRLDRFGYHLDQVLNPLQARNPKLVSHFHNDRTLLCLYLALEYPDLYCLFDYTSFVKMMEKFESRNIPTKVEVERYYKSCRGIFKLISKDEELMQVFSEKAGVPIENISLMFMSVFMEWISEES